MRFQTKHPNNFNAAGYNRANNHNSYSQNYRSHSAQDRRMPQQQMQEPMYRQQPGMMGEPQMM